MLNLDDGIEELSKLLKENKLIAFVGSGISVDSGLPTWDGFLSKFVEFCREVKLEYKTKPEIQNLLTDVLLENASKELGRQPANVAMVLKEALLKTPDSEKSNIERSFRKWFYRTFDRAIPNQKHDYIVSTNYPYILTSNYDLLLEEAEKKLLSTLGTYSLLDKERVASALYTGQSAIIHIHGTYEDALFDKVIFTAKDYIEIVKKKHPGSSFLLQTLFLRYSTVFLGYGASDPHLEDLMEELSYFFDFSTDNNLPKSYLVVTKEKDGDKTINDGIFERYKKSLRTELIVLETLKDYDTLLNRLSIAAPRI